MEDYVTSDRRDLSQSQKFETKSKGSNWIFSNYYINFYTNSSQILKTFTKLHTNNHKAFLRPSVLQFIKKNHILVCHKINYGLYGIKSLL